MNITNKRKRVTIGQLRRENAALSVLTKNLERRLSKVEAYPLIELSALFGRVASSRLLSWIFKAK